MEKNAIKKFAVWAREELIKRCSTKAEEYGITQDSVVEAGADSINGKLLTEAQIKQRKALIEKIKKDGYEQAIEEVAYTWFNRFAALRFMEVNEVLPSRVRVFTDKDGAFHPQILSEALSMDLRGLDKEKVISLIEDNKTEELYKYLLITQCNDLSYILPGLFQRIDDYTELLFPDNLLRKDSVIDRMVRQGQSDSIPEADWKDQVQIIGWLYQYYNITLNEYVYDGSMSKSRISKEYLPAATTIYTPDWSVRYMVENSLGRTVINNLTYDIWAEDEKEKIDRLKSEWRYYLDEAPQDEEVETELRMLEHHKYSSGDTQPFVDTTLIDPCMGSGHILVYAFDVFMQIYRIQGWSDRDAVRRIIEKNLFGLDIDERAAQLAYFAVMMKACQYDKRFLTRKDTEGNPNLPQPNIYAIPESGYFDKEGNKKATIDPAAIEYFVDGRSEIKTNLNSLLEQMHNAKEYGSIINIKDVDFDALYSRYDETIDEISFYRMTLDNELLPLIRVAEVLSRQYDVVITNPPYLSSARFSQSLDKYSKENYPDEKNDLSMIMFNRALEGFSKINGYVAFITTSSWMSLSGFEKVRIKLNKARTIINIVDYGTELFEGKVGHNPIVAWVTRNSKIDCKLRAVRLVDYCYSRRDEKEPEFFNVNNHYFAKQSSFSQIPGSPIAYWVSDRFVENFSKGKVSDQFFSGGRNKTHNNEKYLRFWWEVSNHTRWQFYDKGGDFRRWYGNHEYVVDWSDEAKTEYNSHGGLYNQDFANKSGICWTLITSGKTAFREKPMSHHYDSGSPVLFNKEFTLDYQLLGFLNTNVAQLYLSLLNPTINMGNTYVLSLPLIRPSDLKVEELVRENLSISKKDWDSYETSWDFNNHPLIRCASFSREEMAEDAKNHIQDMNFIREAFTNWGNECYLRFSQLKENEEELNRIFIDIYGLQDELTPEVTDKDVTVRKADLQRDIRSFISYAVGCMFGRYSIDKPGLIYAGGDFDTKYCRWISRFGDKATDEIGANGDLIHGGWAGSSLWKYDGIRCGDEWKPASFAPDTDNIIPICDDEYFSDDIVGRFVNFVETVFGKETLQENLKFIADALGGKGSPKAVIRNYFLNDFYADHVKVYQKRPIYWLFDSGKKNGFKALIYMHRYQPDTIARMRTDYVHEQQARYRTAIEDLERRIAAADTAERVRLSKQLSKLKDQDVELRGYEEKIHHLADQMIRIDLDDGVKHNYEIFKDVLAKIK